MKVFANQNGFTYILALTIVMIMGIMLGMVGQSWKNIKQREQENELLFRGSQIKEAIENWYNGKYKPNSMPHDRKVRPLMDLKDLLKDPNMPIIFRFIPQSYASKVDDRNPKCAPDCAALKLFQDPMTGKEWTIIRGSYVNNIVTASPPGTQNGGIIGVASQSNEKPTKNYFKDTALEVFQNASTAKFQNATSARKYSNWLFVADPKNDHTKIYRAYHEGW
jgi:type II secretory pathway pseudopilin PulG